MRSLPRSLPARRGPTPPAASTSGSRCLKASTPRRCCRARPKAGPPTYPASAASPVCSPKNSKSPQPSAQPHERRLFPAAPSAPLLASLRCSLREPLMSDLGHVLVLAGGVSFEREVSLSSGRRVSDALTHLG